MDSVPKPSGAFYNWIVMLAIILLSFFGVMLSLICIYAMPDHTVQPLTGAVFYTGSTIVVAIFLLLGWKKETATIKTTHSDPESTAQTIVVKETISDKIMKWFSLLYAFLFVLWGIMIALICVYALPDKSVQPKTGLLYFLCGAVVMASFVFVVWKNWCHEND